jgi:hypothetical protein
LTDHVAPSLDLLTIAIPRQASGRLDAQVARANSLQREPGMRKAHDGVPDGHGRGMDLTSTSALLGPARQVDELKHAGPVLCRQQLPD